MKAKENTHHPRLAENVAQSLREQYVDKSATGAALPTVRELASKLGVSVPTVRAAQALLAQRGLLSIRKGSGVYVAGASQPRWIGIVSELDLMIPNTSIYFRALAHDIREQLEAKGWPAELYIGRSQPGEIIQSPTCRRLVADACSGQLAGLVIMVATETPGWLEFIRSVTVPCVGFLTPYTAGPDHNRMLHVAAATLRQQGASRLAVIGWGINRAILQEAATVNGLQLRPEWLRDKLHPQKTGAGREDFREIWGAHSEKPDALLIADDLLADDAARAIAELGIRMPEQLRIAACANRGVPLPESLCATRIEIDPVDMATALVDLLVRRLEGKNVPAGKTEIPFKIEGKVKG